MLALHTCLKDRVVVSVHRRSGSLRRQGWWARHWCWWGYGASATGALRRRPRPRSFQRGMVSLCRTFQSLRSFSVFITLDDHPSAQSRTPERSHVVPVIPLPTHTQGSSRSARVSEDAGRPEVIRGDGRGIGPCTRTTSSSSSTTSSSGGGGGAHVINMSFNISQTKVRF